MTPAAFLATAVAFEDEDSCLLWPFSVRRDGYGQVRRGAKMVAVHREVCAAFRGLPPSPRHEAAHRCNVKRCCNRHHLRWATRRENQHDRRAAGTHPEGEKHGMSKLTDADVLAIRESNGTLAEVGKRYQVGKSCIHKIRSGERWQHL